MNANKQLPQKILNALQDALEDLDRELAKDQVVWFCVLMFQGLCIGQ